MLSDSNRALISSLKGRVSKVLNIRNALTVEEVGGLEGIYNAIDTLFLSKKDASDLLDFKEELQLSLRFIKDSKREYIKEHIIPVVNKISTKKWRGNE